MITATVVDQNGHGVVVVEVRGIYAGAVLPCTPLEAEKYARGILDAAKKARAISAKTIRMKP